MYTQKEIATIKALYLDLISCNHIKIDLDGFGNPVGLYSDEAERRITAAITACKGFDWPGVIENASSAVTLHMRDYMIAAFQGRVSSASMLIDYGNKMALKIQEAAVDEIKESIFTTREIIEMLYSHPDYPDLLQANIRKYAAEDEDTKDRHFTIVREHAA